MRIYFDACSLQRPLDDRSQPRVNVEAEAVLTLLRMVEVGRFEFLSSEALEFEIGRSPNPQRREGVSDVLGLASQVIELNDEIEAQAGALVKTGLKSMDALHVACASWAKADYFCTCDDKLLKKSKSLRSVSTQIVSPLELVAELVP